MNKHIIPILVILLFIISAVSPMVIGYETPFATSESSAVLGNLPRDEEEIHYYNPDTLTHVIGISGDTPPYYWSSAIRLTQDELAPYAGWEIGKVLVFLSCDNGQSEVWANLTIYGEGTPTKPGEIIYQDTGLYFNKTNYYKIPLDEPIPISKHNEIWIAMTWKQTEGHARIAFADEGPAVDGKGDWSSLDGGASWQELQNYGLDYNWGMGAIVGWNWWPPVFIIRDVKGPIGVNAVVENVGGTANNLEWSITITGGILDLVNKHASGTKTELAEGETEPISSGLILGFGKIFIEITADADNAYEVSATKTGFILGPFVFGIKSDAISEIVVEVEPEPDLECEGDIDLRDVYPGETVESSFQVLNLGDSGSLLDWEIIEWPEWGKWNFTPSNGDDLPSDTALTVEVTIIAPDKPMSDFIGQITVVNKDNPNDSCIIDIVLSTELQYSSLFSFLIDRILNRFPILNQIANLLMEKWI